MTTEIKFLRLESFCMLCISCTWPLQNDCFDVLHDLLQPCSTLQGHVRGHQDLLFGVEELFILYIASALSLHANRFDVPHDLLWHLCTWSPCPWPPWSTSCGWRTFTCCTLHLLWIFMTIVLMSYMTYFNPALHFMAMSVATKINFLGLENLNMLHISSSLPLHANRLDVPHVLLWHLCTSSPCPWPPRSTACGWRT